MTERGELELAHSASMPAPQGGALPTGLEWQALERMAATLADSDVIPYRLKRKPADIAVILLAAREYGIPPLMALAKLPVVNGTPAPMGELMVALVLRAGHRIKVDVYTGHDDDKGKPIKHTGRDPITELTFARCVTRRRDEDDDVELDFTFREAIDAGLVELRDGRPWARVTKNKSGQQVEEVTPWEQYPVNMLRWRAVANACRLRFPDVLLGLSYLPEELGAVVDAEGAPVLEGTIVEPAPAPRRAPAGSIEQRTAQEAADRLATFAGDPGVLDNVLNHARENGYATALVTVPTGTKPLEDAILEAREALAARTVDAVPADAPPPPAAVDDSLLEVARGIAYDALRTADAEDLRQAYRDAKAAGILEADVRDQLDGVAGIDELIPPGEAPLGALIMALGKRLAGGADTPYLVEDPDSSDVVVEDPPADPWAPGPYDPTEPPL